MTTMKQIYVPAAAIATVQDVAQLILRLPYADAIELANCVNGDVDKIIDGATAILEAAEDTEVEDAGDPE